MAMRMPRGWTLALIAVSLVVAAARAWGIGFILGESKEDLKLEYDIAVTDHGTGRVTIVLTIEDEGRLAPLDEVELAIPAREKNTGGGSWMDLVVSMEMRNTGNGKRMGRVHLLKELAERLELRLNTHTMDGKADARTRLHHVIPIASYLESASLTDDAKTD